jgi:hypothetical protein
MFSIRLGVPGIEMRWKDLCEKSATDELSAEEKGLHKKWGKAMALLASDPRHPGLNSHEIGPLSRRYGERVWQSYLENRNPRAARACYPDRGIWLTNGGSGSLPLPIR